MIVFWYDQQYLSHRCHGPNAGSAGAGASPFLLAPFASGAAEIDRRRELLRKRNQRLKIGFDEADLPPEQQLEYIRCLIAARALRVQCAVMCSTVYWLPTAYCESPTAAVLLLVFRLQR